MVIKDWNIEKITGYKPITTFYTDFSIADNFGIDAIKDTYTRSFNEWKSNYKYLTELVMALNWKCWEHSETNEEYSILYEELFYKLRDYALDTLKDDELKYFLTTID